MGTVQAQGGYAGPDRRRHRVFVTRNSEYHCRDGVCVAVRDRVTQRFMLGHGAIGQVIASSIRFARNGSIESVSRPSEAVVGEQLMFNEPAPIGHTNDFVEHAQLITSEVKAIERPEKEVVWGYPRITVPAGEGVRRS